MIGIVIVSHSSKLAEGLAELTKQMVPDGLPLAVAAGIDDPENPFGTDAIAIQEAISSIYSEEGVLVLMDLGSAILSAEMALEFLPADQQAKVKLCEAPLVEGTIAAAVRAGGGASLEEVMGEARNALEAKAGQLLGEVTAAPPTNLPNREDSSSEIRLRIKNPMGLHARPAAKFVTAASGFQSGISLQNLTKGSGWANGKSINQVMTLGLGQGDEVAIVAAGDDALAALEVLRELVEGGFGEDPPKSPLERGTSGVGPDSALEKGGASQVPPLVRGVRGDKTEVPPLVRGVRGDLTSVKGIPISPGVAIAPVAIWQSSAFEVEPQQTDNPEAEWGLLGVAMETAKLEIEHIRQQTANTSTEAEGAIFDAHLLYLSDPSLLETTHQKIFTDRLTAASAWQSVIKETMATYQSLDSAYLKERGADIFDVGQRVLRLLGGKRSEIPQLSERGILVARELNPSQVAKLDGSKVAGICTVGGSALSHGAILARNRGIPAVFGVGPGLLEVENGRAIALNGDTGEVWLDPEPAMVAELERQRETELANLQSWQGAAGRPSLTRDGCQIKVMANIASLADAKVAGENGADGVGLLRTELLYLDRNEAPTEGEQVEIYGAIAEAISPHPLTIRVLDIGGDKPLPFLPTTSEEKTGDLMLGWRGIRVLLDCRDLFKSQLKAILRASCGREIKILLPMVASVLEVRAAKEILAESKAELREGGVAFKEEVPVGIMIEVPGAVAVADKLGKEVDFFSIGTNDLSQYLMAADRGNSRVSYLADGFEPAVLRTVKEIVKAAGKVGISVSVCGELASEVLAVPILLGLGVDELSVNAVSIPKIKAVISELKIREAREIAGAVLELDSAVEVREYVGNLVGGKKEGFC